MTYMFILKCALKLVPKKYPNQFFSNQTSSPVVDHVTNRAVGHSEEIRVQQ